VPKPTCTSGYEMCLKSNNFALSDQTRQINPYHPMPNPLREFFTTRKWWLLLFAGLIFAAYQADNTPRTDDEYLGEQVYWLLHDGKVRSNLGYGHLGYHIYQSIFHKLFVYSGYISCSIFGWSLYSLHLVSIVCMLLFLLIFYRYCIRNYPAEDRYKFFLILFLLLFNQDLLYAAANFRPEIMIMALGFGSYSLLQKFLKNRGKMPFIFSAICAGLCMFAHLNGLIFIAAGCVVLWFDKRRIAALLYALIATIAFLPYFADVVYHADLACFWRQFTHDPVLHAPTAHWYTPFVHFLDEQTRFLFTEKQIVLTATLVLSLLFSFKKLKQKHGTLLLYTLVLVVTLAIICPSKSTKYMVLYLPFLYIILVEGWMMIERGEVRKRIYPLRILILAGLAISLFYSGKQITANIKNLTSAGLIAEHETIAAKIPGIKDCYVIAPRIMVFNLLGRFRTLSDIGMIAPDDLEQRITSTRADYIIFPKDDPGYYHAALRLQENDGILLLKDSTAHYLIAEVKH
jgi:hypothetical protein